MAYETTSVFDVLASDDTDRRVASRRALALAHTRVDHQLGAFLKGAVTSDEFEARLAAVRPELDAHVVSACEETGHAQPEHITASLIDHFRVDRRWQPRGAGVNMQQGMQPQIEQPQPVAPQQFPQQGYEGVNDQGYMPQGQPQDVAQGPGVYPPELFAGEQDPYSMSTPGYENQERQFDDWGGYQPQAANNPSDQEDTSNKAVTCPECGGSKKTANGEQCPKCHGKGIVRNFGDSVLDHVARVATETTGLGEAEPKMDKRKWTPSAPGMPDDASKMHPVKHKDPLEVIPATNRSEPGHELTEIGEQTTVTEKLPAASENDSGFYDGGQTGPHTKTFPKGDQASPVTRDSQ